MTLIVTISASVSHFSCYIQNTVFSFTPMRLHLNSQLFQGKPLGLEQASLSTLNLLLPIVSVTPCFCQTEQKDCSIPSHFPASSVCACLSGPESCVFSSSTLCNPFQLYSDMHLSSTLPSQPGTESCSVVHIHLAPSLSTRDYWQNFWLFCSVGLDLVYLCVISFLQMSCVLMLNS